jgi:hypothetical protein
MKSMQKLLTVTVAIMNMTKMETTLEKTAKAALTAMAR